MDEKILFGNLKNSGILSLVVIGIVLMLSGSVNVTAAQPNITNITTNPSMPVHNDGTEQNISINFTSSEYPIGITLILFNEAGNDVNASSYPINSPADLPINYTIPNDLSNGNYTLNMTAIDSAGNFNTITIGNIIVNDTTPANITNITTNPGMPISNDGTEQNISINFTSSEYSIDITLILFNEAGNDVNSSEYHIDSFADLPINYTIPDDLSNGNYTLNMTAIDSAGNFNTLTIGNIIVGAVSPNCTSYDFDDNAEVDIFDAVRALEHLSGELSEIHNTNCSDVNKNGLDLNDVLALMDKIVGEEQKE